MIVPKYWSESKTTKVVDGRRFTIKRFGWSNTGEFDAKTHSEERLAQAITTLEEKGDVRRIDHKVSYNGAEGIPIREEVISNHADIVISRNSYGALCLNTPDILFADIDLNSEPVLVSRIMSALCLILACSAIALWFMSWAALVIVLLLSLGIHHSFTKLIDNTKNRFEGHPEDRAIQKIERFSQEHPELHIRLYRTPMGFRVLLMNDTYSPKSDEAITILKALNSDSVYVQMCRNQDCFRARVSPKPWRADLKSLKPGVWPVNPARLEERNKWVRTNEHKTKNYAACHFIKTMGSDKVSDKAELVRALHDKLSKADRNDLPSA